jgi:hypothetical protein
VALGGNEARIEPLTIGLGQGRHVSLGLSRPRIEALSASAIGRGFPVAACGIAYAYGDAAGWLAAAVSKSQETEPLSCRTPYVAVFRQYVDATSLDQMIDKV